MNPEERKKLKNDTNVLASKAAMDLLARSGNILKRISNKNPSVIEVLGMSILILRDVHEEMVKEIKEDKGDQ